MTAKANPDKVIYQWTEDKDRVRNIPNLPATPMQSGHHQGSDDSTMLHKRVFSNNGVLNITKVLREDTGFYTIRGTNDEGTSHTKLKIEVLYQPR